jgi:hypothetical protein
MYKNNVNLSTLIKWFDGYIISNVDLDIYFLGFDYKKMSNKKH